MATPASVHRQIASGSLDSVYLVLGDDEHEKAELASEFEQAVDEGLRAFNVERFRVVMCRWARFWTPREPSR